MDLAASGAYDSDCYAGTWSIERSEIHVISQPVVDEMCFETVADVPEQSPNGRFLPTSVMCG